MSRYTLFRIARSNPGASKNVGIQPFFLPVLAFTLLRDFDGNLSASHERILQAIYWSIPDGNVRTSTSENRTPSFDGEKPLKWSPFPDGFDIGPARASQHVQVASFREGFQYPSQASPF